MGSVNADTSKNSTTTLGQTDASSNGTTAAQTDRPNRYGIVRPTATVAELQHLHPFERYLYRIFEFSASIKLALVLLFWLMIECIIGTFIEAQVNRTAAFELIYGHMRFTILLALLSLNILCATLIRFPWKWRQTGFVITHSGLLCILFGSMLTYRSNEDSLMSVPQTGPMVKAKNGLLINEIRDPNHEQLEVVWNSKNKLNNDSDEADFAQIWDVDFGPFTWGSELLGGYRWQPDHQHEYTLQNGAVLRIKKFYANSKLQPPMLRYRLQNPERGIDVTQWVELDEETLTQVDTSLGIGAILCWQVDTPEELDHFLKTAPDPQQPQGIRGTLGLSVTWQGKMKHYRLSMDRLLEEQQLPLEGTDYSLRLLQYLPNFAVRPEGGFYSKNDIPENPFVGVELIRPNQPPARMMALAMRPHQLRAILPEFGYENLLSYFPPDMGPTLHLAISPDGKLGYRAFSSQGLLACEKVELGKPYPFWAGMTFTPERLEPMRPLAQPLKRGQEGDHGLELELSHEGRTLQTALVKNHQMTMDERKIQWSPTEQVTLRYRIQTKTVPFYVRLDQFEQPVDPGTNNPAMYTSRVTVFDKKEADAGESHVITMNAPLHYKPPVPSNANTSEKIWYQMFGKSYTLYQTAIDHSTGIPISTYTVSYDPGMFYKNFGLVLMGVGIFTMFYMNWLFKKRRPPATKSGV